MNCELCQKVEAGIHIIEVCEGAKLEVHLCNSCVMSLVREHGPLKFKDLMPRETKAKSDACLICGKEIGTVFIAAMTKKGPGETVQLCETCAAQRGFLAPPPGALTVHLADGASFFVHEKVAREYGADAALIEKYWTPKPGELCLDIGCGPGTWSLAALARGAYVAAFDPKEEAIDMLLDQAKLNKFTRLFAVPHGLWSRECIIPFGVNSFKSHGEITTDLMVFMADDLPRSEWRFKANRVCFINIDAEGAEDEIIVGARETIKRFRPTVIIEAHKGIDRDLLKLELSNQAPYTFIDDKDFLIASVP